jgi:methylenetetrahydrofolate dehydrogenase (NADP+)/methenyltetrahydrofolate cyclohydrolase
VVIDAGFSFVSGKAFGDADVKGLDKKGVRVTPTPGGVGPVTVACLMRNALICAKAKK